jgi:hypothetical protein
MLLSVSVNGILQDLWSALNNQQIAIHLSVINIPNIPSNALAFQDTVSDLNQRDVYPTEWIYEAIFSFNWTESFTELFEMMGYSGSNFITLSGSLLITLTILFFNAILRTLLQICLKRFYKRKWARRLGSRI